MATTSTVPRTMRVHTLPEPVELKPNSTLPTLDKARLQMRRRIRAAADRRTSLLREAELMARAEDDAKRYLAVIEEIIDEKRKK